MRGNSNSGVVSEPRKMIYLGLAYSKREQLTTDVRHQKPQPFLLCTILNLANSRCKITNF